ncbi:uncharacterized protein ISCGN_028374 [Ixodes scapularis]
MLDDGSSFDEYKVLAELFAGVSYDEEKMREGSGDPPREENERLTPAPQDEASSALRNEWSSRVQNQLASASPPPQAAASVVPEPAKPNLPPSMSNFEHLFSPGLGRVKDIVHKVPTIYKRDHDTDAVTTTNAMDEDGRSTPDPSCWDLQSPRSPTIKDKKEEKIPATYKRDYATAIAMTKETSICEPSSCNGDLQSLRKVFDEEVRPITDKMDGAFAAASETDNILEDDEDDDDDGSDVADDDDEEAEPTCSGYSGKKLRKDFVFVEAGSVV